MNAVITSIPALAHSANHGHDQAHDAGVPPAPPGTHQLAAFRADQPAGHEELISLKRIVASPYNVRRREPTGIEALADNIVLTGRLLQNLVVHPMKVGAKKAQTFGVAAGERRRRALALLAQQGRIPADFVVRCLVVSVEDAVLMSATENEMREPMHPADACDAYRALVDAGRSITDIAAIYGVSEVTVQRRLKLARVSPKLVDLYREGEIRTEQMQALALSDSHEEQEAAWFDVNAWERDASTLRRRFTQHERSFLRNTIAQFVGIEAFEAAGGNVRRDLFSDQGAAWYSDQPLMERTALDLLAAQAAQIQPEGWKWAEPVLAFDHSARGQFEFVPPTMTEPDEAQQHEMDAITSRLDAIAEQQADDEIDDERYNALDEEANRLATRHAEIEDSLTTYTPQDRAQAGVIVTIAQDGSAEVLYAWRRRGETGPQHGPGRGADDAGACDADEAEDTATHETGVHPNGVRAAPQPSAKGPHSDRLVCRLNARRTAGVAMALAQQPHIALAAFVHRLLTDEFAHRPDLSAVDMKWTDQTATLAKLAPELADDLAYRAYAIQRSVWLGLVPADSGELLTWCIEQSDERLMLILAQYVAASVDGMTPKEAPHAINGLVAALGLNLAEAWQPTRASYFDHVSKARIVEIVSVTVSPTEGMRVGKLKKGDAATEAERLMQNRAWLPEHFVRAESRSAPLRRVLRDDDDRDDDDSEHDGAGEDGTGINATGDDEVDVQAVTDPEAAAEAEGMPPRD